MVRRAGIVPLFLAFAGILMLLSVGSGGVSTAAGEDAPERRGQTHRALGAKPPRHNFAQADAPVLGQKVIGTDSRERIRDTTDYPWRTVAHLELYDSSGEFIGSCTGTFVGPDVLLTAGLCLWSPDDGWVEDIAVSPGRDDEYYPFGWDWAENWWVPDGYIESDGDSIWDWGLIKMPSSEMGEMVGWRPIGLLSTESLEDPEFAPVIVGYPGDKPNATMWGDATDSFLLVTDDELFYDVDTAGGESGSAIFSQNGDRFYYGYVIGVHTTGSDTYNSGTRIEQIFIDDILDGCDVMECSIDWYFETESETGPTVAPTATRPPTLIPTPTPRPSPTATPPVGRPFQNRVPLLARD